MVTHAFSFSHAVVTLARHLRELQSSRVKFISSTRQSSHGNLIYPRRTWRLPGAATYLPATEAHYTESYEPEAWHSETFFLTLHADEGPQSCVRHVKSKRFTLGC